MPCSGVPCESGVPGGVVCSLGMPMVGMSGAGTALGAGVVLGAGWAGTVSIGGACGTVFSGAIGVDGGPAGGPKAMSVELSGAKEGCGVSAAGGPNAASCSGVGVA